MQTSGTPQATQGRTAAFRQLVLQAAPPVVARALGCDYDYGHAIAAGGTWNRYPAAHRGSPPGAAGPGGTP
jgi:hypothetical protein